MLVCLFWGFLYGSQCLLFLLVEMVTFLDKEVPLALRTVCIASFSKFDQIILRLVWGLQKLVIGLCKLFLSKL